MEENEKIIQFARQKFLKEGFYKISMDELARELSMSKKTIYKHFPSKEKLVEAVGQQLMKDVHLNMEEVVNGKGSAIEKILGMLHIVGSIAISFGDRWVTDIKMHAPDLWMVVDNFRTMEMNKNINLIFKQGIKEGLFEDRPLDILLTIFVSAVRGVVNPDFLLHHNYSFREVVEQTFEILLKGNLTDKGKKLLNKTKNRIQ